MAFGTGIAAIRTKIKPEEVNEAMIEFSAVAVTAG
jgi:hypothetical protein